LFASTQANIPGKKWLQFYLICSSVHAANDVWNGGGATTVFSDPNNWGGTGPSTGDSLEFGSTSPIGTTLNNNLTNFDFTSITYDSSGLGYTINGNPFTNGTSTAATIIADNNTTAQTINNNMILGNAVQTISLSGNLTLGGVISGAGTASSLSISAGSSKLFLNGANTYGSAGSTAISTGTVSVGNPSAFGLSRVNLANGPTIDLNGNNLSVAFINNSAALTGGIIDDVSAGGTVTLKVGSGQGGVNAASTTYNNIDSFSGIIKNTTGTVGLTKVAPSLANQTAGIMASASLMNGPAVLRLINANTYTGPTTISGGMLELNFGQANNGGSAVLNNIISSSSTLVLAGGDLIEDQIATPTTQTFAGLTLNAGASHLAAYRNSSSSATLTLNAITRNAGSTVDFQSRPSGSSSNQKIGAADGTDQTMTANANFTGGQATILGGYATYNAPATAGGGTWAVSAGNGTANGNITALAAFNAGFAAAKDVDAAIGTVTPAAMTINSLRFNTAGAYTVNTGGNIVVATGGILETPLVGANAVAINNNNLTSGNGQDLIIHQYNTGSGMTIGANITDNSGSIGLTKTGTGALTLTPNSANTFSGQLTLNAGTVTLGNANALNGVPALIFGGTSQTIGGSSGFGFVYANGTLNLNGNSASVSSLTASADSSGTALLQNASATPATLTVNGSATTSFTGTLQDGSGGGSLSLVKSGSGSQTLGGTLSYSGGTTISAGTLALTVQPTATTNFAVNGTLNITGLTNSTLALTSPQVLSGSGTVSGSVTVASGAHTHPGSGVTNTITGNLTYVTGAKADFDLNTSATNTPNDQIVLSGASSVLTCGSIQVNIKLIGATLDTNDYVLFKLTGGSASFSGSFMTAPTWLGTVPANSGSYSIVTDTVHNQVRLHYVQAAAAALAGTATPSTLVRNESTFISVTALPGSGTITNVYLDMSSIGGSLSVPLTLSGTPNVYTNTVVIPAAAAVGAATVVAHATDTTPLTGSTNITLTILATNEVWNGGSASDANWSDDTNWVSVYAPGLVGDSVTFDGSTQPTPNMDNSYSLTSLTFDSSAGAFTIGTADSSVLTLTGGLTNNSANAQILNVPVVLSGAVPIDTFTANVTLGGAITGTGGLTKQGGSNLYLGSGANAYTGNTVISNGTVSINNNASVGTNQIVLVGGTFASGYGAGTRYTMNSPINVPTGNTGTIVMSTLTTLGGAVTGGGVLNVDAPGTENYLSDNWSAYTGQANLFGGGTVTLYINGGGFGSGFNLAAVTMTNVSVQVSDNSGGNTINVGALTMDSTATIIGPSQGNYPLFSIGSLNQNDLIAGSVEGSTRITKVGTGNLTISSTSATYAGPTWVDSGTLTVSGTISSSPITNYSGSMLAGTGNLDGPVDLETNSTVTPVVGGYGTMVCGSSLTFNGGTNLVYISTTNSDLITVAGDIQLLSGGVHLVVGNTLTNGVYTLITYSGTESGAAGNLVLSGFSQPGQIAILSDSTAGQINLIVTTLASANLIWASAGAQNNLWDIESSINWSNGAALSVFTPGDHITFNDSGAGNNPVDLRAVVTPSTTVVTGTQSYTLESTTGTGSLGGATNSLTLTGTGSLQLDTVNSYGGPTVIGSGYTLTVGNGSVAASLGTGNITNNGTLNFNQTNNLTLTNVIGTGSLTANGPGTLTLAGTYAYTGGTTIGSGVTLQAGTGGATGLLLGSLTDNGTLILNTSGTLTNHASITGSGGVTQDGSSVLTLAVTNSYLGNTAIQYGVVKLGTNNVTPNGVAVPGSTGWLILDGNATNAGTYDLNGFNDAVNALQGLGGTALGDITNSSSANVTNTLTFGNFFGTPTLTTYAGLITENTNTPGGKIALMEIGTSTNILTGANNFSGGTTVAGGTLGLGNNLAAGSGPITLSNGVTLGISGGSIFIGNNIYVGAGAIATNTSTSAGSYYSGSYYSGDTNSTNVIISAVAVNQGAIKQFQSFNGTVFIDSSSSLRFAATTLSANGGDNTTFDVEGLLNTRNGNVAGGSVSLGALTGAGTLEGAGNANGNTTYTIGAMNANSTFSGTVQDGVLTYGNTSIIKVGTGTLTLSGAANYTGVTTVSNGVLALVGSVNLDNSATINVGSSTATLDVSGSSGTQNLGNLKPQTLTGIGTINGSLNNQANSTVSVGLGVLNVNGTATLAGTNILQLNLTNAPATNSEIVATSFVISGPLIVTNTGPALQGGDTFKLFSTGITGFSATNLPALTAGLSWTNNLALNGTIAVLSSIATNPTNISFSVSGNQLSLHWPADHLGWWLQSQTNSLSVGLATNWVDVAGSSSVTSTNITMDPTKPTVFFRLSSKP